MSDDSNTPPQPPTPLEAQQLLASMPQRPKRVLGVRDHLSAGAIVLLSFAGGALALSGYAWWAIIPALAAVLAAHRWVDQRLSRAGEPRLRASVVTTIFTVWLAIPIWRGITHGETIPFPEAFIFAGLAPAAWLVFYLVLLVRR